MKNLFKFALGGIVMLVASIASASDVYKRQVLWWGCFVGKGSNLLAPIAKRKIRIKL